MLRKEEKISRGKRERRKGEVMKIWTDQDDVLISVRRLPCYSQVESLQARK